jgi:hypothetical protein
METANEALKQEVMQYAGAGKGIVTPPNIVIVPGFVSGQIPMGGTLNLPVSLSAAPAGSLTVSLARTSGDTNIHGSGSLTFTAANYNTPQMFVLSVPANVPNGTATLTLSAPGSTNVAIVLTASDPPPTLVSGPTPRPFIVNRAVTNQSSLSVLGADNNGETNLVYTWSTVGTPPAPVAFALNHTNAAKSTVATFSKGGSYSLRVSAADASSGSVTGSASVVVLECFATWITNYPGVGALNGVMDDPGHQGIPNLLAYAFGLNPLGQNASAMPVGNQQDGYLTLTYRQNRWAGDITYAVEGADTLSSGSWSASGLTEVGRLDKGDYWQVSVSDGAPVASGPSRFLRLKVSKP